MLMQLYLLVLLSVFATLAMAQYEKPYENQKIHRPMPYDHQISHKCPKDQMVEGCACGSGLSECNAGFVCKIMARDASDVLHNHCIPAPKPQGEAMNCLSDADCDASQGFRCQLDPQNISYSMCRHVCNGLHCPCGIGKPGCPTDSWCYKPTGDPARVDINRCTSVNPEKPCAGGKCHCGEWLNGCPYGMYCQMPTQNKRDIEQNTCEPNVVPHRVAKPGELGALCGDGVAVDCKSPLWCYLPEGNVKSHNNRCITQDECCSHMTHSHEATPECSMCGMCVAPPRGPSVIKVPPGYVSPVHVRPPRLIKNRPEPKGPFLLKPNCYTHYYASGL